MSHGDFFAWCPEVPRLPWREGSSGMVVGDWAQLRPAAGKVARYVTRSLGPCARQRETTPCPSEAGGTSDVVDTSTPRDPLYEAAQRLRRKPFDLGAPNRCSLSVVNGVRGASAHPAGLVSHRHVVRSGSTPRSYDNTVLSNNSSQSTASTWPTAGGASPGASMRASVPSHASPKSRACLDAKAGYGHLLEEAEAAGREKSSSPRGVENQDEPHARARELALACAALGMELQKLGDHLSWAEAYVGFEPEAEAEVDSPRAPARENLGVTRSTATSKELSAGDGDALTWNCLRSPGHGRFSYCLGPLEICETALS
eukprot:TRINITY_DN8551_c0_g1_i1.p1 TRINITY_DN8551_c0_g1~~TRINITY_DN8551_c0_g1_i1.p1  ORF type:complete len:314 (+),score=32.07 TRINITY_DN8551_c0_g1_i1:67-1008(+)